MFDSTSNEPTDLDPPSSSARPKAPGRPRCQPKAPPTLERVLEVEAQVADICGVINAAYGSLTELMSTALAESLWEGWKIISPGHWLAWQTGMNQNRAHDLVRVAERRHAFPRATAALAEGRLSLDQAVQIARHVPDGFDRAATEFALLATVNQLQRTLPRYVYVDPTVAIDPDAELHPRQGHDDGAEDGADPDPTADAEPDGDPNADADADADADGDTDADARPGDGAGRPGGARPTHAPPPTEEERRVSHGVDEKGWWLSARLAADQGAVIDQAFTALREDLYRQACVGLPEGAPKPTITAADVLLAMAETALRAGEAHLPGSDRYLVHTHLEHRPAHAPGSGAIASLHLGTLLPHHLRQLLLCDARLRPVHQVGGTAVNIGRTSRVISRRLRRIIEHRDGGCAVPGCHRSHGLEIHHIHHWEDGGPTDTANLVTLCSTHHRTHHAGRLGIAGNADEPGHPDGLRFTDLFGRTMAPSATPTPPALELGLHSAANTAGIEPGSYARPLNERLDTRDVFFAPDPSPDPMKPPEPPGPSNQDHEPPDRLETSREHHSQRSDRAPEARADRPGSPTDQSDRSDRSDAA